MDGRSTSSHDKKFRTRSMEKQGGMAFGFWKTVTAVKNSGKIDIQTPNIISGVGAQPWASKLFYSKGPHPLLWAAHVNNNNNNNNVVYLPPKLLCNCDSYIYRTYKRGSGCIIQPGGPWVGGPRFKTIWTSVHI